MFLKRLELSGFKSFADKTDFDFERGVTAILGPNGCGKSNVVEAIRWVLGEQRASALRGKRMTDVIFFGNAEGRKASNLAEVSLYFDNRTGFLASDYTEVCITRRLLRDGTSDYLINKQPARLRDVRELFMGTGIGTNAYSFIEQGRVEDLVQGDSKTRRKVIEEAAGISKYKARLQESLNSLDRTSQYLLRIEDILQEVESQIRSVKRKAGAARRYREMKAELQQLKSTHFLFSYRQVTGELDLVTTEKASCQEALGEASALAASLDAASGELVAKEAELDAEHDRLAGAILQVQERLGTLEKEHATSRAALEALDREIEQAGAAGEESVARLEEIDQEMASLREEVGRLGEQTESGRRRMEALQAERADVAEQLKEVEQRLEQTRDRQWRAAREQTQVSNELTRAETAGQAAEADRRRLAESLDELEREAGALTAELEDIAGRIRTLEQSQASFQDRREQLATSAADLEASRDRIDHQLRGLSDEASTRRGRLSTLEDLERNLEGVYAGVRAVLREDPSGIDGMVADLLTVPPALAQAVEVALGSHVQSLVAGSNQDAERAITMLKRNSAGRATFLPLDRMRPRNRVDRSLLSLPGVLGDAADLVEYDARHAPAMENLLAGTLVVESLEQANQLAGREARGVRIVTLDGDLFSPSGAMTGGRGKGRQGILSRRGEIETLRERLQQIEAQAGDLARQREQVAADLSRTRENLEQTSGKLAETGRELDRATGQKNHVEDRLQRLNSQREAATAAADQAEAELTRLAALRTELETKSTQLAGDAGDAEGEVARLTGSRETLTASLSELDEQVSTARVELAEAGQRLRACEGRLSGLTTDRERRVQSADQSRQFVKQSAERRAALTAEVDRLAAEVVQVSREKEEAEHASRQSSELLREARRELEAKRGEGAKARARQNDLGEKLTEIRLRENTLTGRLDNLSSRASEELGVNLAEELERFDPGEMDPGEVAERVSELQDKLSRMGQVSEDAIIEQAELEARHAFLSGDRDDLVEAVEDLKKIITHLNRECRRRFEEAFETIRQNFQEMFRRLFMGGSADLVLDPEAEDPLDAGIDMIARPLGKNSRSVTLLSGGEKALCAVALLFSIFRSKPSPFCVLDEVDGPLDDSNVHAFMQVVKDFSESTQFIIISHNKLTMSMTDDIYGVSMPHADGVSRRFRWHFAAGEEGEAPVDGDAEQPHAASAGD